MNEGFKIFFLCEDWPSLNRANSLKEKLTENCRHQVVIEASFCEYSRLDHPCLRQKATLDALEADMIIVTARGTEAMPLFVQNWMTEIGAESSQKIVCAEFLNAGCRNQAAAFHQFMNKWATEKSALLISNLFPNESMDLTDLYIPQSRTGSMFKFQSFRPTTPNG